MSALFAANHVTESISRKVRPALEGMLWTFLLLKKIWGARNINGFQTNFFGKVNKTLQTISKEVKLKLA